MTSDASMLRMRPPPCVLPAGGKAVGSIGLLVQVRTAPARPGATPVPGLPGIPVSSGPPDAVPHSPGRPCRPAGDSRSRRCDAVQGPARRRGREGGGGKREAGGRRREGGGGRAEEGREGGEWRTENGGRTASRTVGSRTNRPTGACAGTCCSARGRGGAPFRPGVRRRSAGGSANTRPGDSRWWRGRERTTAWRAAAFAYGVPGAEAGTSAADGPTQADVKAGDEQLSGRIEAGCTAGAGPGRPSRPGSSPANS